MLDYYSQFVHTDEALQEGKRYGIEPICKYVIGEISYTGWGVHHSEMIHEIKNYQFQWEKTMTTLILRKILGDPSFTCFLYV